MISCHFKTYLVLSVVRSGTCHCNCHLLGRFSMCYIAFVFVNPIWYYSDQFASLSSAWSADLPQFDEFSDSFLLLIHYCFDSCPSVAGTVLIAGYQHGSSLNSLFLKFLLTREGLIM